MHPERPAAIRITFDRSTPVDDLPEFLSPEELSAYLQLGRNTVYDLLRRNEIPHRRFGRQFRIPKSALVSRQLR